MIDSSTYKPMLAIDLNKVKSLQYPVSLSPKLDGIRCVIFGGIAYSRSMKPLPNQHIQAWAMQNKGFLEGLDGEIICGKSTAPDVFSRTTSMVMSDNNFDEFAFHVFDVVNIYEMAPNDVAFKTRYSVLMNLFMQEIHPENCFMVTRTTIYNETQLKALQETYLRQGYEGVMLNSLDANRKNGRSGTKNPELVKVKTFTDAEFEVVGYECLYSNQNEATVDALGHTERSTKKEGMVAQDTLGKLVCKTQDGKTFGVGSGFTQEQRIALWADKEALIGMLAKIKYFEVGDYEVPRFPVFLGFRNKEDL